MKHFPSFLTGLMALCVCAGCGQMSFGPFSSGKGAAAPAPVSATAPSANPVHAADSSAQNAPGGVSYAMDEHNCRGIANSRLSLYDKPAPFGVSEQEKQEAYQSLYSSCMRGHDWQVAGPAHTAPAPGATTVAGNAAQFANLSPAAGGGTSDSVVKTGGMAVSTSQVPGATVIVIGGAKDSGASAAQLSSLGPSSGVSSAAPSVTVVQAQPSGAVAIPANYMMPNTVPKRSLPVAVPVPPLATAYAPQPHATLFSPSTPVQTAQIRATKPKHLKGQTSRAPRPSLATAESDLAADSPQAAQKLADRQLETVLEK